MAGLVFNETAIARNFAVYGPFAATERLLMAAVKAGANRQEMHEVIREHALQAWAEIGAGRSHQLIDALCADPRVTQYVDTVTARTLLDARAYVGNAPQKARMIVAQLQAV
jgi:adenylosuccinate lyase